MRLMSVVVPVSAAALAASAFLANFYMNGGQKIAQEQKPAASTPQSPQRPTISPSLWPKPKYADFRPDLTVDDEIAALESVQLALTEVGDGSTYVWHRQHGNLSGIVQPTASFKDAGGRVCRHLTLLLSSGAMSKRAEGIACRLPDGIWQLDG